MIEKQSQKFNKTAAACFAGGRLSFHNGDAGFAVMHHQLVYSLTEAGMDAATASEVVTQACQLMRSAAASIPKGEELRRLVRVEGQAAAIRKYSEAAEALKAAAEAVPYIVMWAAHKKEASSCGT